MALFLLMALSMQAQETRELLPAEQYELSVQLIDSLPDSALYYANLAEVALQKSDPESLLPQLYKHKGKIYQQLGATDRSLFYYRKAYDDFIREENYAEIGQVALILGNFYNEFADYSEAYYFYLHSLNAFEREGDRMGVANMENNLGTVAHEMGKLEEAEVHYQNAHVIYMEEGSITDQCQSLNNLGTIYYDRQVYDTALSYFSEALQLLEFDQSEEQRIQYFKSGLYNNMALAYSDMGEMEMALDYLRRGLRLARQIDDDYFTASVYNNLGALFGELRKQDSALFYLHRALKISKNEHFRHLEMESYDELAQLHARTGSYASAYNWLLRYDTVYKDLFNENQAEQIARLRSRYEQELADRQIEQLNNESRVQRLLNVVFAGFILVVAVLGLVLTINLRARNRANRNLAERNQDLSEAMARLRESEKELQVLNKSKDRIFTVVAHDLRNPVAAVGGFSDLLYENFDQFTVDTQKEYLQQIQQANQRITVLLENLLIWARTQMDAVKYEPDLLSLLEVAQDCVKELKANLDYKKVNCELHIDKQFQVYADKNMLRIILRNLLGNAIKFSFPGGKIWMEARVEGDFCYLSVIDEGIGISSEILHKLFDVNQHVTSPGTAGESGSGLGLVICKDFVEQNGGSIDVESESGKGAQFRISLPTVSRDR